MDTMSFPDAASKNILMVFFLVLKKEACRQVHTNVKLNWCGLITGCISILLFVFACESTYRTITIHVHIVKKHFDIDQ